MQQYYWKKTYERLPPFACPMCSSGKLRLREDAVVTRQAERPMGLGIAFQANRLPSFVCLLVCENGFCKEAVSVAGRIVDVEITFKSLLGETFPSRVESHYRIDYMSPSPKIIQIPLAMLEGSRHHLLKAFDLLWVDPGSCANRLRIVVETLLDEFNVDRTGTSTRGKTFEMNLAQRIEKFEESRPGHKTTFEALRHVGNHGSHRGDQDFDTLLNCFELIEYALEDLIDNKAARLTAIAERLIQAKGNL